MPSLGSSVQMSPMLLADRNAVYKKFFGGMQRHDDVTLANVTTHSRPGLTHEELQSVQ